MGEDITNANVVDTSNAFCCSTPTTLSAKNIPAVVAVTIVMISHPQCFSYDQSCFHQ